MQKEEYVIHERDLSNGEIIELDGEPAILLRFEPPCGDECPGDVHITITMTKERALEVVSDLIGALRRSA